VWDVSIPTVRVWVLQKEPGHWEQWPWIHRNMQEASPPPAAVGSDCLDGAVDSRQDLSMAPGRADG